MPDPRASVMALLGLVGGPFTDPGDRMHWLALLTTAVVALVFWVLRRPPTWTRRRFIEVLRHPSTELDVQIFIGRQLLGVFTGVPVAGGAWWMATHGVRWLDHTLGTPAPLDLSPLTVSLLYTAVLFVCWDASRWALHYLAHQVPLLWEFHQVHHSAEVMTPLTFHRIHPVESLLAAVRSALVTSVIAALFFWLFRGSATHLTILGVPMFAWALHVCTGNLRHSHVWIPYPAWLERWLLSPAQHQLHHAVEPQLCHSNYGTWLAIWDRMAGTLNVSTVQPKAYGVPAGTRNHGDDLVSAWLGPFRAVLRKWRGSALGSTTGCG